MRQKKEELQIQEYAVHSFASVGSQEQRLRDQLTSIRGLERRVQALEVQCSMQEKLIKKRSLFTTQVHVCLWPSPVALGQSPEFRVLGDQELGLAKQLAIDGKLYFADSFIRSAETSLFDALDLEPAVLGAKTDLIIGVLREFELQDCK